MKPLFTIITVTYNAAKTIERTLKSVKEQTCRDYEHLIVDGKSTDSTMDIVMRYVTHDADSHIRCVSENDNGIYDAMNKGITLSHGKYLIFLNAGDKFHTPETLAHYEAAIKDNDYPGIVYGQTDIVDDAGTRLGPRHLTAPEVLTLDSFRQGMVVCHQAMAVNVKIAILFNLKYKYSSDYEWCIIALQHSKSNIYLPEVTIDYLSEGQTTAHHRESLKERFKIMSQYYGRTSTIVHHLAFLLRYMRRRAKAPNKQ